MTCVSIGNMRIRLSLSIVHWASHSGATSLRYSAVYSETGLTLAMLAVRMMWSIWPPLASVRSVNSFSKCDSMSYPLMSTVTRDLGMRHCFLYLPDGFVDAAPVGRSNVYFEIFNTGELCRAGAYARGATDDDDGLSFMGGMISGGGGLRTGDVISLEVTLEALR